MAGLASLLGYKKGGNPFLDYIGDNRGALLGLGAGIAGGGPDFGKALGTGLQLAGQGQSQDEARADAAKKAADEALVENWVKANSPEYAGLPSAQGFQLAAADRSAARKDSTAADPSDVATYKFYANQELQAGRNPKSFADWYSGSKQASKAGLGAPIWGKHKTTGEYMPFEPMSDGTITSLTQPNADLSQYAFDPGTVASDKAAGNAYGALQGPQQFNLPKTQQDVETELGNIDALIGNSTGLDQSFGNVGGITIPGTNIGYPNQWTPTMPNSDKAGFQAQLLQVQGENFLAAYATLRGAGAITENEGQAAKEAMARLSTAQSKEDFVQALTDLKAVLKRGYDRMAGQTTMGPYQSNGYTPAPLNTGGGDLKQKYGLD